MKIAIEKLPPWCLHLCISISCPEPCVCTWESEGERRWDEFDRWQKMGILPQKIHKRTCVVLLCSRAPKSAGINCIFPLYCSTPCGYNIQNPLLWTRWWVTVQLLHLVTKDINPPLLGYIPHIQTLVRRYIWHMSTYICRILQIWELGWLNQPSVSGGEWCHYIWQQLSGDRGTVDIYQS